MANYKYPNARARAKAIDKQNRKYKREKQTAFTLRFHNINDKDVIDKINAQTNKIDYVRQLIRADIKREE